MKRKNWLFAAFVSGLCILVLWVISFFIEYSSATTFEKVIHWILLAIYVPNTLIFYYYYKKELKKEMPSKE